MNRKRVKGRSEGGSFIALPHACLRHENYIALSNNARALLIDLYSQYNGKNNGDFCCTWSMMKKRGWKSQDTLNKAKKELLYYEWILCTRIGGLNMPSLYAVTFQAIDECKGKLDMKETNIAPGKWKDEKTMSWKEKINPLLRHTERPATNSVVINGKFAHA